jgi:hypothetical protein
METIQNMISEAIEEAKTPMGYLSKIEYASNDNNSTAYGDNTTAVNRENGSLAMRTNPSAHVNKHIEFPTKYNPVTDILEFQVSSDRNIWHHLNSAYVSVGGGSVYPFQRESGNMMGVGIQSPENYDHFLVTFGRYRLATTEWSSIPNNWYWRVVKKTYCSGGSESGNIGEIDEIQIEEIVRKAIEKYIDENLRVIDIDQFVSDVRVLLGDGS